jgi:hypothetical protein
MDRDKPLPSCCACLRLRSQREQGQALSLSLWKAYLLMLREKLATVCSISPAEKKTMSRAPPHETKALASTGHKQRGKEHDEQLCVILSSVPPKG